MPVENFELLAFADPPQIHLDSNPINAFCLSNCLIDTDHNENRKPVKIAPNRKIDGVISVLMTLGLLLNYRRSPRPQSPPSEKF